jgi:hypothetical protein
MAQIGAVAPKEIKIFQPHYVPGATQPLTEMNTRNLPGGKEGAARNVENLTPPPP